MRKKRICTGVAVFAAILVLAAGGYALWCNSLKDNKIWSPYIINGVSIEGMTKKEAGAAIQEQFEKDYGSAQMTLEIAGEEFQADVFPILGLDASETIEKAYELGHGEWYTRGLDWYKRYRQKEDTVTCEILPTAVYEKQVTEAAKKTGIQKVDTLVETSCELKENSLVLHKGSTGVTADMKKLEAVMLAEIENNQYEAVIECPVISAAPKDVELQPFYEEIYKETINAKVDPKNNYTVTQSQTGVSFDVKKAEKALAEAPEGETVIVDFVYDEPKVSTAELEEKLFRDVLGSYTTYGGGTANRIANITLAVQSCDGVVLMPGETFSYNETLGERTAERGYKSAVVYVNGQSTEGIGGGICQVSTTLFAACLYADMEIVERYNHSLTVAYVPLGMDAAVSWGGPDFKFRNNTGYPVKISASYQSGTLTLELTGTREGDNTVDITTQSLGGLSVKTFRNHYDGQGNLLSTEDVAMSTYKGVH